MSNKLAKGHPESRLDVMNRVSKQAIMSVRTIMSESDLTPIEIISVLEVIADSFSQAVKANERDNVTL
jgi:hypothetical protein